MKSLTTLFNEKIGIKTVMNEQDEKEYLDERAGIRMYSGNMPESIAIDEAKKDLQRFKERLDCEKT